MAHTQGLIRIAGLSTYQRVADRLGLDSKPLLHEAGLTPAILSQPEQFVPVDPVVALLEESARVSGCPTFGLRMALDRPISDGGLVSVLFALQPNLDALLRTFSRYRNSILPILLLIVERHEDIVVITPHLTLRPDRPHRQVNEFVLAVLVTAIRSVLGQAWQPECVFIAYPEPAAVDRPVYQTLFGRNLQFNASFNGLTVLPADMDRPREGADPGLVRHAKTLLAPFLNADGPTYVQRVRQAIIYLLGSTQATLRETAAVLGVQPRTLQRRLVEEEVSFSQLVRQTRAELATRFLANPNLSIAQIADALGYSSAGAFSRWYRQEFGRSPRQGRA